MSTFLSEKEAWDRFILIVKPEQSGKTFVMIQKINEFLQEDMKSEEITVNFIMSDNNLLLTKQTKERVEKDVNMECLPDIDEPYIEFSYSSDKNNKSKVREAIEDGCRNVICCTNGRRVKDIKDIIERLNKNNRENYNFKIWMDEVDKFESYIQKIFIPLAQENDNINVYMLTATPQRLFNKFGEVRTMALENTTLPTYHGWRDNNIIIMESEGEDSVGFARKIANEMKHNNQLLPGTKGYVPSSTKKETHYNMRDMFLVKGVAVFVVNGDGIELTLPNENKTTDIIRKKKKELSQHILELYEKHNVSRWPCIITGALCIGRGITIQTPDFMFSFGILSNCSKKSEASQNAGRLKGNMKDWKGYSPPTVYTTQKFNKIADEYEKQSREIAKLAFSKSDDSKTAIITKSEMKNIETDKIWDLITDEFDNLHDANEMLKENGCRCKYKFKMDNGFIKSTTTEKAKVLKYQDVKETIKGWSKTSAFDTNKNKNKKIHSRMIISYKDLTDKNSVVFIVRIIKKKD